MKKTAMLIVVLFALFVFSPLTHAADFHVNGSTGIDSTTCGVDLPCKTIDYAVTKAGSGTHVVKIAVGDYSEKIDIDYTVAGLSLQGGWSADFSVQKCDPNLTVLRQLYSEPVMELTAGAWRSISVDLSCLTFKGGNNDWRSGINLVTYGGSITLNMDQSISDGFAGNGIDLYSETSGAIDMKIRNSVLKNAYQPPVGASLSGGGINVWARGSSTQTITLENSILFNNEADSGAAISLRVSGSTTHLSLTNVTLSGNRSIDPDTGGGLSVLSENSGQTIVDIQNSILWSNTKEGTPRDINIIQDSSSSTTVNARYSILGEIYNYPSAPGTYNDNGHNLNVDPRLNSSYHLRAGSPAIDAARCGYLYFPDYTRVAPYDDIDGDSRPGFGVSTGCDIGADEWYSKAMPWLMLLLE